MTIKKTKTGGSMGILAGLQSGQVKDEQNDENVIETIKEEPRTEIIKESIKADPIKEEIKNVLENESNIDKATENVHEDNKALDQYDNIKDELDQAKEIINDDVGVRRTFSIDTITNTELDELKVYIQPAVTFKKKWSYNDIVNLAITEFYARQKIMFNNKISKMKM
jgi:hypothetical protein